MQRDRLSKFKRVQADASMAAAREHVRLGTNLTERVDIFGIIQRERVWLMFQPLRQLYGTYVEAGRGSGIIIHSGHPASLQRFTAAHEYGHRVLGHGSRLDAAEQVMGTEPRLSAEEVAAHAFAANFLMPLQLVNTSLRRLGLPINGSALAAHQIYSLSLELGASYSAALNQLVTLKKITQSQAVQFRRLSPKQIKLDILTTQLDDPRIDIWTVTEVDAGRLLYPRVDDEVQVSLPETPSTGFVWIAPPNEIADLRDLDTAGGPRTEVVALVDSSFEPSAASHAQLRIGTGGTRHMVFKALKPGRYTLRLERRRPWNPTDRPSSVFEVSLQVSPKQWGGGEKGLAETQQHLLSLAA